MPAYCASSSACAGVGRGRCVGRKGGASGASSSPCVPGGRGSVLAGRAPADGPTLRAVDALRPAPPAALLGRRSPMPPPPGTSYLCHSGTVPRRRTVPLPQCIMGPPTMPTSHAREGGGADAFFASGGISSTPLFACTDKLRLLPGEPAAQLAGIWLLCRGILPSYSPLWPVGVAIPHTPTGERTQD